MSEDWRKLLLYNIGFYLYNSGDSLTDKAEISSQLRLMGSYLMENPSPNTVHLARDLMYSLLGEGTWEQNEKILAIHHALLKTLKEV